MNRIVAAVVHALDVPTRPRPALTLVPPRPWTEPESFYDDAETEDRMSPAEPPATTVVVRTDAEIATMRAQVEHYARIGRENVNENPSVDAHAEGALAFCKWMCGDLNDYGLLINWLLEGEGGEAL